MSGRTMRQRPSFLLAPTVALGALLLQYPNGAVGGHCYSRGTQANCEVAAVGGQAACAWCNGGCQMEWDTCTKELACDPAIEGSCSAYFVEANAEIASGSNPNQRNYGVAITDADGDGLFDAFVGAYSAQSGSPSNLLLSHKDGKLRDIAKDYIPDTKRKTLGVTACDVDGDGREEIYLLNLDAYSGSSGSSAARDQLFSPGDAGAPFTDLLTEPANAQVMNQANGRSVACVDRNGDGKYSVFVSNYASNGAPKAMLVEMGDDGSLEDVAPALNMDTANGGRAVVAGQLFDEHVSLFVNNEGGSSGNSGKNYLYIGKEGGQFEQAANEHRVEDTGFTGRGTIMMDANGDGLLDLVYGNWNGYHRMFLQQADRRFIDAAPTDLRSPSPIRTIIAADWDNDGYEEIFFNNIPGANRLFSVYGDFEAEEAAQWQFRDVGDAKEPNGYGTGAGVADFDGDGRLELLISHGESDPNYQGVTLYRAADGADNHWIRIMPKTVAGAPARGALVQLTMDDGRVQTRTIDGGSGYLCAQEPVAHFGLGQATTFKTVTIRWPNQQKHVVYRTGELAVDAMHTIDHPSVGPGAGSEPPAAAPVVAWAGQDIPDLHNEYWNIFVESGNRNAASHLWATFLFERAAAMPADRLATMFAGFCPVSGSPVNAGRAPYGVTLKSASTSDTISGYVYYCCSPCVCDTLDLIKTDTKTVTTSDGVSKAYDFLVIGDPCKDASAIPVQAPEIKCTAGKLDKATLSDNGHVIIGMLHPDPLGGLQAYEEGATDSMCAERAAANYPSGMGTIFREVASIDLITSDGGDTAAQDEDASVNFDSQVCAGIVSEAEMSQIWTTVASHRALVYGVPNVRCTLAAQAAFDAHEVCYHTEEFESSSQTWKYFQCLYPDEAVGATKMHSYVFIGGTFAGNGFRLLQDSSDYRCTDGNSEGKGEFCLSWATLAGKLEDAGAKTPPNCGETTTAAAPTTTALSPTSTRAAKATTTAAVTVTTSDEPKPTVGSTTGSSDPKTATASATADRVTQVDVESGSSSVRPLTSTPTAGPDPTQVADADGNSQDEQNQSVGESTGTGGDGDENAGDGSSKSSGMSTGVVLLIVVAAIVPLVAVYALKCQPSAAATPLAPAGGFANPQYATQQVASPGYMEVGPTSSQV